MHDENDANDRMTNGSEMGLSQLQQEIHATLRVQHPEWVEPNGDCTTSESYESRLAKLLGFSSPMDPR